MLAILAGVPGKLKTLIDRLTSTRAANLDNLNATITSRAAASTALSNATWTDGRAAKLDNITTPLLDKPPIAAGLVGPASNASFASTTSAPQGAANFATSAACGSTGAYVDVINVTGSGLLTGLHMVGTPGGAGTPTYSLQLIIDGVTIGTYTCSTHAGGGNYRLHPIHGQLQWHYDVIASVNNYTMMPAPVGLPFKTSLQIRVSSSNSTVSTIGTYYSYIKTS